jgi:hypothetical protein
MKKYLLAVVVLGAFAGGVAYAQTTIRSGDASIARFDYVEADYQSVECAPPIGSDFELVADMSKTLTQGGLLANEVVVAFSAPMVFGGGDVEVRLVVDGIQSSPIVQFPNNGTAQTLAHNFISDPVSPGTHMVGIQWRSPGGGDTSCVSDSSMVIYHR